VCNAIGTVAALMVIFKGSGLPSISDWVSSDCWIHKELFLDFDKQFIEFLKPLEVDVNNKNVLLLDGHASNPC